ncbi:MAG: sulfatase-like hydrolase/transferase [Bacteroidota bacterium]
MKRKLISTQSVRIVFLVLLLSCTQSPEKEYTNKPPNFIVLLADDQAWSGTSVRMDLRSLVSKSDYYETPNLERLAETAVRFSRGYAASSVCAPTRYSIQFGQAPTRLNRTYVGDFDPKIAHDTLLSIPKMLREINGLYHCAHFGKWHLEMLPGALGYNESDGLTTNREGGFGATAEHDSVSIQRDPKLTKSLSYHGADYMERMVEWNKPFYLQLSYYANHTYVTASQERVAKYQKKVRGKIHDNPYIAAMTEDLDEGIGIVLDKIKELGIEDHTYIIYLADNGSIPAFNPLIKKDTTLNFPLSGGKWDVHEGGVRVPFLMAGPGLKQNTQFDQPVYSADLLPTIADLADPTYRLPDYMDGGSIVKALQRNNPVQRSFDGLLFDFPKLGKWAMLNPARAWLEADYKLIYDLRDSTYSLFQVSTDIREIHPLDTLEYAGTYESYKEKMNNAYAKMKGDK